MKNQIIIIIRDIRECLSNFSGHVFIIVGIFSIPILFVQIFIIELPEWAVKLSGEILGFILYLSMLVFAITTDFDKELNLR
jgi:hypothetical protein